MTRSPSSSPSSRPSSSPAADQLRAMVARTATPTLLQAMRQADTTTTAGRILYATTGAHLARRLGLDPFVVAATEDPAATLHAATLKAASADRG